jgi:uncharacterized protein
MVARCRAPRRGACHRAVKRCEGLVKAVFVRRRRPVPSKRVLNRTFVAETRVFTLFERMGRNVARTADLLAELMAEHPDRPHLARDILDCEHEGDNVVHDLLHGLAEGRDRCPVGLTPSDVHRLAGALDDIVDHAEECADRLVLYGVEAPLEQAVGLSRILAGAAREVAAAVAALRDGSDVTERLCEIRRLEKEGDRLHRSAVAALFAGGIDPMVVIRWKDILQSLENAVDSCATVANQLEGIALRRR